MLKLNNWLYSATKQKVAGFTRYLAELSQYSDLDCNKVTIRLYLQLLRSYQVGYAKMLSCILTIYAQDPAHPRPNLADFNSTFNQQLRKAQKVGIMMILVPTTIPLLLNLLYFLSAPHAQHNASFLLHPWDTLPILWQTVIATIILFIITSCSALVYMQCALRQLEKQLYQGSMPTTNYKLSLDLPKNPDIMYILSIKANKDVMDFVLKNVPPYIFNETHIQTLAKLFPYFNHQVPLSSEYHLIAPYAKPNFQTPQDVDNLLTYLSLSVSKSPHNYHCHLFSGK